jgi:hypothetical protein
LSGKEKPALLMARLDRLVLTRGFRQILSSRRRDFLAAKAQKYSIG